MSEKLRVTRPMRPGDDDPDNGLRKCRIDPDPSFTARQHAMHRFTPPDTVSKTFPHNPTPQDYGTLLMEYPHAVKGILQQWCTQKDPRTFALVQHLQGLLRLDLTEYQYDVFTTTGLILVLQQMAADPKNYEFTGPDAVLKEVCNSTTTEFCITNIMHPDLDVSCILSICKLCQVIIG